MAWTAAKRAEDPAGILFRGPGRSAPPSSDTKVAALISEIADSERIRLAKRSAVRRDYVRGGLSVAASVGEIGTSRKVSNPLFN